MTLGWITDRRVWIGFGMALSFLLLSLLTAALLLVRGVLPMTAASVWVWLTYGAAAFLGGKVAAAGQGRQLYALLPALLLYLLVWVLALSCNGSIQFLPQGMGTTVAVAVGSAAVLCTSSGKRKRTSVRRKKPPVARQVRR